MRSVAEKLSDKRVFVSSGVPAGKAMLLAECGRVMAVVPLEDLPEDQLLLTDTVCLSHMDSDLVPNRRER